QFKKTVFQSLTFFLHEVHSANWTSSGRISVDFRMHGACVYCGDRSICMALVTIAIRVAAE
ncbi:MAG TPA: hypothetical protein VLA58_01740, partial [Chitinophagaceae bacterium]|nr:hypothetical protein [Chitinophagaceae bacterium]